MKPSFLAVDCTNYCTGLLYIYEAFHLYAILFAVPNPLTENRISGIPCHYLEVLNLLLHPFRPSSRLNQRNSQCYKLVRCRSARLHSWSVCKLFSQKTLAASRSRPSPVGMKTTERTEIGYGTYTMWVRVPIRAQHPKGCWNLTNGSEIFLTILEVARVDGPSRSQKHRLVTGECNDIAAGLANREQRNRTLDDVICVICIKAACGLSKRRRRQDTAFLATRHGPTSGRE